MQDILGQYKMLDVHGYSADFVQAHKFQNATHTLCSETPCTLEKAVPNL